MWVTSKVKLASVLLLAAGLVGGVSQVPFAPSQAGGAPREVPPNAKTPADRNNADVDRQKLQGTWKIVSNREQGRVKEVPEGSRLVFDGDKLTRFRGDLNVGELRFVLNPAANPKQIDLIDGDRTHHGIYELDGNRLKICVCEEPGGERPADFTAERGTDFELIVLEKAEPGGAAIGQLRGDWVVVSSQLNEREVNHERGGKFTITSNRLTVRHPNEATATFEIESLDPTKTPQEITLRFLNQKEAVVRGPRIITHSPADQKEVVLRGIYQREGDELKLCLAVGTERPTEFAAPIKGPPGTIRLYVLKRENPPKADAKDIQGAWNIISVVALDGEDNGRPKREDVEDEKLIFKEGRAVQIRGGRKVVQATYKLDASTEPKSIDLTINDQTMPGIYELKGGELKLCFNRQRGGPRPTKFVSEADSPNDLLMILKRQQE